MFRSTSRVAPGIVALALLCVLSPRGAGAQQQGQEVSFAGVSGANPVIQGNEVLLYTVELRDAFGDGRTVRIGQTPPASGIHLTLSDRFGSGTQASDFVGLHLYRGLDGNFATATDLKTQTPVTIDAPMTLTLQGVGAAANRIIPDPGDVPPTIYFFITAEIAPGAVNNHAFTVDLAGGHIDMRDQGPPGAPLNYTLGTAIPANINNFVIIDPAGIVPDAALSGAGSGSGGASVDLLRGVPFAHPWVLVLLVGGYAVFAILRRG